MLAALLVYVLAVEVLVALVLRARLSRAGDFHLGTSWQPNVFVANCQRVLVACPSCA